MICISILITKTVEVQPHPATHQSSGVFTTLAALLISSAASFIPLPDTPFVGKLPLTEDPESYDIAGILVDYGIKPDLVNEILVYVFFTGLGDGEGPASRAFYEIYTESYTGVQYKQFLNALFNQPDTVINSANLWIPYCNLAAPGYLYAHKISANYQVSRIQFAAAKQRSVEYKNLHKAMNAYVQGADTIFRDVFLIGYR